jgi:hypothetical protein
MMRKNILFFRRTTRPLGWLSLSLLIIFSLVGTGVFQPGLAQEIINDEQGLTATPDNIFGVEMVTFSDIHGKAKVVEANTSWVRLNGVLWSDVDIDGNPDNYQWSKLSSLESQLADAKANNVEVILVVRSTPTYAQKDGLFCGPIKEVNFKEFANFLSALVNRYKAQVKYWEIWNEPDAAKDSGLNTGTRNIMAEAISARCSARLIRQLKAPIHRRRLSWVGC